MDDVFEEVIGPSYDQEKKFPMSLKIHMSTYVIYAGDVGVANKVIDKRELVFFNNTTAGEILSALKVAESETRVLYKEKHSYIK
jgi:hypothetical protein